MKGFKEYVRLDEVCQIIGGGTPSKANLDFYEGEIPWATVRDMKEELLSNTEYCITKEALKESSANLIPSGNVIIATRVGLGKVCVLNQDTAINQDLRGIIPKNKELKPEFLFWYFKSISEKIISEGTGATVQGVKLPFIKSLLVPKISIEEQQQIVTLLDEAFAAIDQAKANIEKNIANAKELFQSKLNEIFSQKGEGWEEKSLGELGTLTSSKRIFKNEYVSEGIPFYRSKEIKELSNESEISLELFISTERYNEIKSKFGVPQKGDILLTAVGTIGEMYVVEGGKDFYFKDGNIMWLKDFNTLNPYYLKYALSNFVEHLKSMSQGAAYSALTIEKLKKYKIPIPDLNSQNEIVFKLDEIHSKSSELHVSFLKKTSALEELKKSILQKAFAGKLTSTVSVNSYVGNKQPSSQLFEKIAGISPTDLQAGLTAIALNKHIESETAHTFHHVKAEKIIHLAEYALGIDLERNPIKDAAGPNDFKHSKKIESRAKKAGFYTVSKHGDVYEYYLGTQAQKLIDKATVALGTRFSEFNKLIELLVPMNTQQAEIVATVYAAWNNLLIQDQSITDEAIVLEARENWHKNKLKIERNKFFNAIEWMKKHEILIPKGNGKMVTAK